MKFLWSLLLIHTAVAAPLTLIKKDDTRVTFEVELATTDAERAQGLQGRTHLDKDAGMLFVFSPPQDVAMWMFNTPLSLDMLFMDEKGAITHIFENTTPYSKKILGPLPRTAWVLELEAGTIKSHGLQRGDRIDRPS